MVSQNVRTLPFVFFLLITLTVRGLVFGQSDQPIITRSFPRDGDRGVMPNAFISLAVRLPSGEKGLDMRTLSNDNLRLYPAENPGQQIPLFPMAKKGLNNITIEPLESLTPKKTYVLEVKSGLQTVSGISFRPYVMRFTVGDFPIQPKLADRSIKDTISEPDSLESAKIDPLDETLTPDSLETEEAFLQEAHEMAAPTEDDFLELVSEPSKMTDADSSMTGKTAIPPKTAVMVSPGKEVESFNNTEPSVYSRPYIRLKNNELRTNSKLNLIFEFPEKSTMALVLRNHEGDALIRKAGMIQPGLREMSISLEKVPAGEYLLVVKTRDQTFRSVVKVN